MTTTTNIYPTFGKVTTEQFKQFVLPLKNKLYRFALSFVQNEADAKDVVQDVMIKSWRDMDLEKVRNMEALCITMTRNRSLDQLRKKGRNHLKLEDQFNLKSAGADPMQTTSSNEINLIIRQAIAKLPDKQRDVINLRDIEGHSYKEIAALLSIDINHVKVLLHRGRQGLRKELKHIYSDRNYSN